MSRSASSPGNFGSGQPTAQHPGMQLLMRNQQAQQGMPPQGVPMPQRGMNPMMRQAQMASMLRGLRGPMR